MSKVNDAVDLVSRIRAEFPNAVDVKAEVHTLTEDDGPPGTLYVLQAWLPVDDRDPRAMRHPGTGAWVIAVTAGITVEDRARQMPPVVARDRMEFCVEGALRNMRAMAKPKDGQSAYATEFQPRL